MRTFDYCKFENQQWDTDILNLVAKIHECKGRQELFVRQKPVELERLVEIAKIQSTEASNKIEGIVTTSTRLRQLFKDKVTPRNRDENEIVGYKDVLNTIHENHDFIPIKSSYILQLHKDLLKKSGLSFAGNYKSVQNYISEILTDGTVVARFTPLAPYETPNAIEQLCNAYENAIAREKVDALLLIPIYICDFLCIHPFNDGNGRMSRLLTLLLLYKSGYNVGKYISIEKEIEKTKNYYYDALEYADVGWHEDKNDPRPFIRYMLQIILACYIEFEDRVGLLENSTTSYDIVKKYIDGTIGIFTSVEVVNNCPSLGRSSVLAIIKTLTEEGHISRYGSGRSTYYIRKKMDDAMAEAKRISSDPNIPGYTNMKDLKKALDE